ncbi:hypothetical protein LNK15_11550, partial [Jeotgalicoccus huakuii]|nr:hypothetical protein [Jeotgalicoccus huakuii]
VSQMVDRVMAVEEGTRLYILAPIVRGRKGEYKKELAELQKKGFQRVKVDGTFYEIADVPALDKKYKHDIDVVVDRVVVRPDLSTRLADSLETCLKLAEGLAVAEFADKPLPPEETAEGGAATSRPTKRMNAFCFRKSSPARSPASPSRKSSRACSRSTIPSAPARPATALARSKPSIPT